MSSWVRPSLSPCRARGTTAFAVFMHRLPAHVRTLSRHDNVRCGRAWRTRPGRRPPMTISAQGRAQTTGSGRTHMGHNHEKMLADGQCRRCTHASAVHYCKRPGGLQAGKANAAQRWVHHTPAPPTPFGCPSLQSLKTAGAPSPNLPFLHAENAPRWHARRTHMTRMHARRTPSSHL